MDPQAVSRYPFTSEAQEFIRGKGVSLSDVLTSFAYRRIVEEGLARVQATMTEDGLPDQTAHDEEDALVTVLSYPIARMLVSAVADILLIRRYALREAKAAHAHWVHEDEDFLITLAREELEVPAELLEGVREAPFRLHFTDYLRNASALRAKPWKLHNQDLQAGYVYLGRDRFARLLQEALRRRIESELPLEVNEAILEALSDEIGEVVEGVERLRETIQRESYGEFSLDYLPPCMRDLLEKMQKGVNLPHAARFALTAFLSHVGLDADDILDLFRTSSDFRESIASYQVKHVLGDISGTKYNPPACATMQTYGICLRDKRCERVGSPLRYYFREQRRAERRSGTKAPEPETASEREASDAEDAEGDRPVVRDGEVGRDA